MNRDELLVRAAASPPRTVEVEGPDGGTTMAIMPRDEESGGTWIGANEHGLTVALANVYARTAGGADLPQPQIPVSRGLLVKEALGCRDLEEALALVAAKEWALYKPFHLICFGPHGVPRGRRWDGTELMATTHRAPGLIATSSSRDQDGAQRIREALFESAAKAEGGYTDQLLDELHESREPEAGPYAVSMERSDAATVSMSTVSVTKEEVAFLYTPGPPHRTEANPPVTVSRLSHRPLAADATSLTDLT